MPGVSLVMCLTLSNVCQVLDTVILASRLTFEAEFLFCIFLSYDLIQFAVEDRIQEHRTVDVATTNNKGGDEFNLLNHRVHFIAMILL